MKRKTKEYKNKRTPDCEFYEKGKCSVYDTKCCGYDDEECPVAIDNYDPYLSGDIEEW